VQNSPPVADAGDDQSVAVGTLVQLDGSGSHDPDGTALSYSWSFSSRPGGSGATLSNPNAVKPTFTADVPGQFVVRLVVSDGLASSAADQVTITATAAGNTPPVADAGDDQTVLVGNLVQLDGGGSSDANGDALTYAWSFTSRPDGSAAALSDPAAVNPTFTADLQGDYVVSLTVSDGKATSAPDNVTITATPENQPPVADAGDDQTVLVDDVVQLDGSGSSDPDGGALAYSWSFVSRPGGSTATLSSKTVVNPTFTADVEGDFVIGLTVSDGLSTSAADYVTITARTGQKPGLYSGTTSQGEPVSFVVSQNGTYVVPGMEIDFQVSAPCTGVIRRTYNISIAIVNGEFYYGNAYGFVSGSSSSPNAFSGSALWKTSDPVAFPCPDVSLTWTASWVGPAPVTMPAPSETTEPITDRWIRRSLPLPNQEER
jgi:hypothetical protein